MVIFDGNNLCVDIRRTNYKNILDIISGCGEYVYDSVNKIIYLPPKRSVARKLFDIGCKFDESAVHFTAGFIKTDVDYDERLLPFQKDGVKFLLEKGNRLLADYMGLGKTIQAVMYLKYNTESRTAIIITPATLKKTWEKEISKWTDMNVHIIDGTKIYDITEDFAKEQGIIIINYDILGIENDDLKKAELSRVANLKSAGFKASYKPPKVEGWCDMLCRVKWRTIIADEVQYISSTSSIRARAVKQICFSSLCKKIFISGTPYETKTSQFYTALHILRPDLFPNEFNFKMRYCDPKKTRYGWKFEGISNVAELREKLSEFMIRRTKEDVLPQLPPKTRSVVYLDVSKKDRAEYDRAESDFVSDLHSRKGSKKCMLAHITEMKGYACRSKQKAVVEWIKEYLSLYGDKLVVFVHHKFMYDYLMQKFQRISVGINGSVPAKKRQDIVDKFQRNKKIKLFIGEIKSCGAGITLTASNTVCFVEFGQTCVQHEQAEDRVHRIGQDADKVFAFYLLMSDSVEESMMATLNRHNRDMKLVMDNKIDETMFKSEESDWREMVLEDFSRKKRSFVQKTHS